MPKDFLDSEAQMEAEPTVYHTMNGPNEFHVVAFFNGFFDVLESAVEKVLSLCFRHVCFRSNFLNQLLFVHLELPCSLLIFVFVPIHEMKWHFLKIVKSFFRVFRISPQEIDEAASAIAG